MQRKNVKRNLTVESPDEKEDIAEAETLKSQATSISKTKPQKGKKGKNKKNKKTENKKTKEIKEKKKNGHQSKHRPKTYLVAFAACLRCVEDERRRKRRARKKEKKSEECKRIKTRLWKCLSQKREGGK